MKQYILAFGATLLLSGCGIYTRYEAQTTVPDNLYGDEAENRYGRSGRHRLARFLQ